MYAGLADPASDGGTVVDDTHDAPSKRSHPEDDDAADLTPTTYFARAMGMTSEGWKRLCTDYGCDTTDGLLDTLKDGTDFEITCDVLKIEGTPITAHEEAALAMVAEQVEEMDQNNIDAKSMFRTLRDTE